MSGRFSGKVAVVTGSSSGIGQAIALLFAREGAKVTIHGRSENGIKETKRQLSALGVADSNIFVVMGPVEDDKVIRELIEGTVNKFGRLDILVNNAGTSQNPLNEDGESAKVFDYLFDVNLKSITKLTCLAVPHLEKTKGNIINVSSVGSTRAFGGDYIFYQTTKAALDHYTRNTAIKYAPKGIRVNALNPGFIRTNFIGRHGVPEEAVDQMEENYVKKHVPMARMGTSEEMAKATAFLASDDASYVTGTCLIADGGFAVDAAWGK
jgi:NAD(P)-dependent dehydrogenase (short-subunit alcohol dehydrogenase family)